jgi:COMPASS component SWD3
MEEGMLHVFDPEDPKIKQEINCLIMQYLQDEGYTTSFLTMQDESNVRLVEQQTQRTLFKRMRKAILEGDWVEVDKLCGKMAFQQQKAFLYAAYRAQFVELIEAQEYQKAFTHLQKRLKPLEGSAASLAEFKDLCYLLTCRSVHEVLPNWQGAAAAREALLAQFATMLELEERRQEGADDVALPERRLVALLEQAAAYQVSRSALADAACALPSLGSHGADAGGVGDAGGIGAGDSSESPPAETPVNGSCRHANGSHAAAAGGAATAHKAAAAAAAGAAGSGDAGLVTSLLHDYSSPRVPNVPHRVLQGHSEGVKSIAWLGSSGVLLSAGNDQEVRLWAARSGECIATLHGHASRVWHLSVSTRTQLVASAAADGAVRLWRLGDQFWRPDFTTLAAAAAEGEEVDGGRCAAQLSAADCLVGTLTGHTGDVYSVNFHPSAEQIVTAGYDRTIRIFDTSAGVEQRALIGHELPARAAVFNATGNLVVSGGKDATLRFWDVRSALCVRKLGHSLGEVTSVQLSPCGTQLLASSKDNSVRLWDVRAARPLRAFKGHQNTSKNFVRARFGPTRDHVLSGSEDGAICLWNVHTARLVHRLRGHHDVTYDAAYSASEGLLASCSHDGTVRTWRHDPAQPLTPDEDEGGLW